MKIKLPKKISIYFVFILISLYALLNTAHLVQAQSVVTLTAIPPRLEITAQPGETIQETIKIRNDAQSTLITQTEVKDFIVTDNYGTPMPVNEQVSGRWSLASWINISPTKNTLKIKDMAILSLVITVPPDALPGGHYAMVLHQPLTESMADMKTGTAITQKVGTLVYLTVAGPVKEDAQITRFEADKYFAEYGPINLLTELKNLSDIHIRPTGTITIYNMLNKVSDQLNLQEVNIFPLKSRIYESLFAGKWRFGRYKAILTASYGTKGNQLSSMLYFWIIPWKLILLILFIILALLLVIFYLIKRKQTNKQQPSQTLKQNTPPAIEMPSNKNP